MSSVISQEPDKISSDLSPPLDVCQIKSNQTIKKWPTSPSKGMDDDQFPNTLFHRYLKEERMQYMFDVLPLPFKDQLKYQEMHALSTKDGDLCKQWKEFLYKLPDAALEVAPNINEKFWRWKNVITYVPTNKQMNFRYTMTKGPTRDHKGPLPIVGEELHMFREYREAKLKPKLNDKHANTKKEKQAKKKDRHEN